MNKIEIQQKIWEIWKEVLNKPDIKIDDNFFVVGGDSIKAIRILEELQQNNIIREMPAMSIIYSNLTVEAMTNYIYENIQNGVEEGEL